jgi:hypothetical protein
MGKVCLLGEEGLAWQGVRLIEADMSYWSIVYLRTRRGCCGTKTCCFYELCPPS